MIQGQNGYLTLALDLTNPQVHIWLSETSFPGGPYYRQHLAQLNGDPKHTCIKAMSPNHLSYWLDAVVVQPKTQMDILH